MLSSQSRLASPELFPGEDKLAHLAAFGLLGYLMARAIGPWRGGIAPAQAVAVALLATSFGIIDEIHQSFVPGRTPSLGDILADATGAGAVALLLARHRVRG